MGHFTKEHLSQKNEIGTPRETTTDKVYSALKAGWETLPTGSLITWLVENIWRPPINSRTEKWMEEVSESINKLNLADSQLSSNERFITTLTKATQLAIQNHSVEKRKALRNCVINSISEPKYDESLQTTFLGLIDRLSDWHLRIFIFLCDENWTQKKYKLKDFGHAKSATFEIVQGNFDELKGREDFIELIFLDLRNAGLVSVGWESLYLTAINRAASLPKITPLGKDFLSFIQE